MSFHKLKIGQRKQKSHSKSQNSSEKGKDRELFGLNINDKVQLSVNQKVQLNVNQKMQLNMNEKVQSVNSDYKLISTRKPNNIISISDDFPQDMLKFKKPEQNIQSKTDRVHKIERLQFGVSNNQVDRSNNNLFKEMRQPNMQGEYSTASSMINFLSVQKGGTIKKIDIEDRLESMKGKELRKQNKMTDREEINQITQPNSNQNYYSQNQTKINNNKQKVEIIPNIIDKKEIDLSPSKHYVKYKVNMTMRNDSKKDDNETHVDSEKHFSLDNVSRAIIESNSLTPLQRPQQWLTQNVSNKERDIENRQLKQRIQLSVQQLSVQPKEVFKNMQNIKQEKVYSQSSQLIAKPIIKDSSCSNNTQGNAPTTNKNDSPQQTKHHPSQSFQSPSHQYHPPNPTQQPPKIQSPTRSILSYKPINQIQLTILQQNKTLQQQVQKLRKQRDQLQFKSKRQQIQLLQSNNTQYYTRQINRLKQQVQNLQSVNQQFKHQNFMLMNKNKQIESTLQIKVKQTKKMIQELQRVKIDSTKEKFQLRDKSNQLAMIVKQMESRNAEMSEKFQLYYGKAQDAEAKNKMLMEELSTKESVFKQMETKLTNEQRMNKDKYKMMQNQVTQLFAQKQQAQNNLRQVHRLYQSQTQTLKQSLKQLTLKRQSQALLISTRAKSLQKHNTNIHTQMQVVKLQQELKQLQGEVIKRSSLIKQLNKKIDDMINMSDYEELRVECERINHQKVEEIQQYQRRIYQLEGKLIMAGDGQRQIEKQQQQFITNSTSQETFKQLLKQQILQQDQLKQQLFNKEQSLHKLKQQLEDQIIKYQGIKNDYQILKKQFTSFENNSKVKKEIAQQEMNNQIETLRRKHTLLQKKLQSKIKQNQQKELFIQTYIVGNNKSTDSQYLIKEIQRIFLEKQKNQLQ